MRLKRLVQTLVILFTLLGLAVWWLASNAVIEVDPTPLHQGPVTRPVGFGRALASRLFLNVRLDLDALEKGSKAMLQPFKVTQKDPLVDATVKITAFDLNRISNERLGLNAKVDIDGGVQWGIFTVKDMSFAAQGNVALSLSSGWDWQLAPDVSLKINKVDARPGLPDWLVKGIANLASGWVVPGVVADLDKSLPPPKPMVQELWNQAQQRIVVLEAPRFEVSSEPVGVLLRQPVLDETSNDLDFGMGVSVRLLADVSSEPVAAGKATTKPDMPAITLVDASTRETELLLPVMLELGEVQRHFQAQEVPWDDGSVQVSSIELSDKDGTLNARIHFAAQLPSAYKTPLRHGVSGSLSFHVKPGCDPITGKLKFENFDFSQTTDSRLVNLAGPLARDSLKKLIEDELPQQLDSLIHDVQSSAQTEANRLLLEQRDALSSASPQFAELLRAAKLQVAGLQVRPYAFQVREGYLLCVVRVNANLGITLE